MNFRTGLASAAILAFVTSAALAQTPAPATPPPAAPPAPATPAPDATPAPAAVPAPPPPPAPKPLPTTGEIVQILSALDHACVPLVGGANPKSTAQAAGMRVNRDGDLYLNLDGGNKITIAAPSPANPTNCAMTVTYATGGGDAILDGLAAWASNRPTPLPAEKVAAQTPEDRGIAVTSTWVAYGPPRTEGLLYIQHKKADGSPLNTTHESADILFSNRPG
jgi:hypothetical protein